LSAEDRLGHLLRQSWLLRDATLRKRAAQHPLLRRRKSIQRLSSWGFVIPSRL